MAGYPVSVFFNVSSSIMILFNVLVEMELFIKAGLSDFISLRLKEFFC